jgi:tripartite ATP-independent transporter DctM subunit
VEWYFLFIIAVALLMLGVPVAFAFGGAAILYAFFTPEIGLDALSFLPSRIYGSMQNFTLLAIPLFVFMGLVLEKSGIARRLLEVSGKLFGGLRGGLGISVVLIGALLAASTGVIAASVLLMSIVALPSMLQANYNKSFSAGIISSSATLGQIIPPSIILILLAEVLQVGAGELFKSAFIPGFILVGVYILYILVVSNIFKSYAPPVKGDENSKELVFVFLKYLLPPVLLVFAVLGSIFLGIASPTESAAVGALGAVALSLLDRSFSLSMLKYAGFETAKYSAMIMAILIGASAFSLVFNQSEGVDIIFNFFDNTIESQIAFVLFVMLIIFILGFFLDFIEIVFVFVPIFLPLLSHFDINPIWFGVLIALNLQTSFLTPPFGFALFFLKSAAGDRLKTLEIYKGVIPFILLQLVVLAMIIFFPEIILGGSR